MDPTIRLVQAGDAVDIQKIYAPNVRDSPVSFERTPPSADEIANRIENDHPQLPWLVCEDDGSVVGYAYAGPHRTREAYQWSVDSSVYVHEDCQREGIARGLYISLFEILRLQGFYNVYAGIALPNPASVGFHESMGFEPIGVYKNVGYTNGSWHDVKWWHRTITEHAAHPEPPLNLSEIRTDEGWNAALAAGQSSIRADRR